MEALWEQLEGMPPGFARTAVAEQAVREADAAGDLGVAFDARMHLASVAAHGGEPQKAIVAVTWCLAQIDAHPDRFEVGPTYWALKWLPGQLSCVPEVPLSDIEAVLAEIRRRFGALGTGQDAVAKLEWQHAELTGRLDDAVAAHRRWRLEPRTDFGDCRACDTSAEVDLALELGQPERALELARPLLAGRLECAEQPALTLARLLTPLHSLGRHDEAERLHRWGLRLARGNPSLVWSQADHLQHLVRTGRLADAVELLAELVALCDGGLFDAGARMVVAATGAALAAALHADGHAAVPRPLGTRPLDTVALAAHFAEEARGLAGDFDRRDGTDRSARRVEERIAVRPVTGTRPAPAVSPGAAGDVGRRDGADASPVPPVDARDDGPTDPAALLEQARGPGRRDPEERLALAERAREAWERAGDRAGAARAHRTVGAALLVLDRIDEAGDVLADAADGLHDDPHELVLCQLLLADVAVRNAGRIDIEAQRRWEAAVDTAERSPEPAADRGRCLARRAEWLLRHVGPDEGRLAEADRLFQEARRLCADDPELELRFWSDQIGAHGEAGDAEGAARLGRAAWSVAGTRAASLARANIAEILGCALLDAGEPEQALEPLQTALRSYAALGARVDAANAAGARTATLLGLDRPDDALAQAWETVDLHVAAGEPDCAAWMRLTIAQLLRQLGRDLDAHDLLAELVERASDDGDDPLEGLVALEMARLDADYGHFEAAEQHVQRALAVLTDGEQGHRGEAHRLLARVLERTGRAAEAVTACDRALVDLADVHPVALALVQQEQADRLVLVGRIEEGLAMYEPAREAFAAHDHPIDVAAVDLGRADALGSAGRRAEAVALASAAAETGRREGSPLLEADALWVVARLSEPEGRLYDRAIGAYREAGAPDDQLADLRAQRDAAVRSAR